MSTETVVLFVGPPGSGKGTLSQRCIQKLGWKQLSTGDLCRAHIANETEIGKKIDFAIKSGKLVSDGLISQMVFEWFSEHKNGPKTIIVDGYPRTVQQAIDFDQFVKSQLNGINVEVAKFDIDDPKIVDRLSNRYICKNKSCQRVYSLNAHSTLSPKKEKVCDSCGSEIVRRKDDVPEAIKERLKVYHVHEGELLSQFENAGYKIQKFKSDVPIDQLFTAFKNEMEE